MGINAELWGAPPTGGASHTNAVLGTDALMGLAEYLEMVADYWSLDQEVCDRCDMCIEAGYCAMLHDSTVPDGDCLGLLAIGVRQPDEVPNAGHEVREPA